MFDSDEKAAFRNTQTTYMMDRCIIQRAVIMANEYNEQVESFADTVETRCGVDFKPGSERHLADGTIVTYDAVMRLPLDVEVKPRWRVKLIRLRGDVITPQVYEVDGPVQYGGTANRINLRAVER